MRTASNPFRRLRAVAAAALLALALAACGQAAGEDSAEAPAPAEDVSTEDAAAEEPLPTDAITVVGVDYGFDGLPAELPIGTALAFRNDSDVEAHEMVVFKIAEGEDREITELLQLSEEEAAGAMTFVGGAAALPNGEGEPLGEGPATVTLAEAGRYALVCHFPVGADPEAIAEAMSGGGDGPPDLGDGPPHFTEGMVAEVTVR